MLSHFKLLSRHNLGTPANKFSCYTLISYMIYNIFSNNSSPIGISAKALVKDKIHNFYFDSSFVKEKFKKS